MTQMTRNISISPTNSSIDSSGYSVSTTSSTNSQNLSRPKPCDYIKTHKNISFSFAENLNSFQLGNLGESDTYLVGTVHLNYPRVCAVKSVFLHFKGIEKTCWYKSQARTKILYSGEHVLVDQSNKIWEAFEESEGITVLEIPFKIQLPYGLQETIITNIGTVQYVLRAVVNTKGLINIPNSHITKLHCPLKHTLILNNSLSLSSYKICGESPNGIEYTFILPPNKNFNMGSYVSIPMMIRFLRPGIGIDRLEISLKALMDFSCSTQNEKTHNEQRIGGLLISNSELRNIIPNNSQYNSGEYIHTINLFVPRDIQQTYQGNLISISHQLSIKFCLFGFEKDFRVEENIRISRIFEKKLTNEETISTSSSPNYNSQMYINDDEDYFSNLQSSQQQQIQQMQQQQIQQQQQQQQQIQYLQQQQQQKIQYQQNLHQNQQNIQLTQHESFDNRLFRSHSLNYHQLVAPFDDKFDDDDNNFNNNNRQQLLSKSHSQQSFHPQQHFLYKQPSLSNLSIHSSTSSNGSNHFHGHNSLGRRKLPQLSIHEDSSESDISSHSLPSPPPVVNEINTKFSSSSTISKSPYPTPLSPPPYRQPVIRESSFGNKNSAYYKYKKYTE